MKFFSQYFLKKNIPKGSMENSFFLLILKNFFQKKYLILFVSRLICNQVACNDQVWFAKSRHHQLTQATTTRQSWLQNIELMARLKGGRLINLGNIATRF